MHQFADRAVETTTSTGTGALTLSGALTGFRTLASGLIQGIFLFPATIEAVDASGNPTGDFETSLCELTSSTTLERRFVLTSSNGNALVNFGAGTKRVYVGPVEESMPCGLHKRKYLWQETDFLGPAGAGTMEAHLVWDYAVISSGTQSKTGGTADHPGILSTTSSTTANSGGYCLTDTTAFLIGGGEISVHVFRIVTLTNSTIRIAFLDTTTSADATDGVYIEIPATGDAVGKTASNGTRTTSSTIATLSTATWYSAVTCVNFDATNCWFGIYSESGTLLGSQTISTNIPTGAGRQCGHGFVATNSGTTAVGLTHMDYMAVGILRPMTR